MSKQLLEIITGARRITEFDIDLYFAVVEKMKVYDAGRRVVSLLDVTELDCEMEYRRKYRLGWLLIHLDRFFLLKNLFEM